MTRKRIMVWKEGQNNLVKKAFEKVFFKNFNGGTRYRDDVFTRAVEISEKQELSIIEKSGGAAFFCDSLPNKWILFFKSLVGR